MDEFTSRYNSLVVQNTIIEYPGLESTHRDDWVLLLTAHRVT